MHSIGAWPVPRMRLALAALIALAVGGAPPAHAQACSPRPAISVSVVRDGTVTISGGTGGFTQVAIGTSPQYEGSASNVAIDLPGAPASLPAPQTVTLSPAQASYVFHLYSLAYPPVTVPLTITDACGPWQSLVGGGTNALPTHVPTATRTLTPPPPPTATPPPGPTGTPVPTQTAVPTLTVGLLPTATPQTIPQVGFYPADVLQGNTVTLAFSGSRTPTATDYLVLTNPQGLAQGPPVYTSSCTSTPGSVAQGLGKCAITLGVSFPAGSYQVRWYASGGQLLLAVASGLTVRSTGGALVGRGQLWGTEWMAYLPDINITGGFIGNLATINAGDPGYLTSESWDAVGVADFAFLGQNFVETGADKFCGAFTGCQAYPYMSWRDNFGDIQSVRWSGGPWPLWQLPLGVPGDTFQAKVYALAATRWNGEFCDTVTDYIDEAGVAHGHSVCCPLWTGACNGIASELVNYAPATLRGRFPWIWYGAETPDPDTASGVMHITDPAYCCPVASSQWFRLDCWNDIWDSYDKTRVWTFVSDCAAPGIGFDVVTGYR